MQVDHSEYVKFTDFDEQTIKSLTKNSQVLTVEQSMEACSWLGASPKALGTNSAIEKVSTWNDRNKTVYYRDVKAEVGAVSIPLRRGATNNFDVGTPITNKECANKEYVDGIFAELLARIETLENK